MTHYKQKLTKTLTESLQQITSIALEDIHADESTVLLVSRSGLIIQ